MSISELHEKNECFDTMNGQPAKKKRVIETIRHFYGAIQSATFFRKKNHFFLWKKILLLDMVWLWKKCQKKLWCSFFWGQNGPEIFFWFSEKSQKNRKKCVFFGKKLMVSGPFCRKLALPSIMQKNEKSRSIKMSKKNDFRFLKLFFKNEIWTFIFVHFWI